MRGTVVFDYGEKGRHVDSNDITGKDPYYDTTQLSRRLKNEVTIFDAPQAVGAGQFEYKKFFDSYLIVDNKAIYHVHWELDTQNEYTNISGNLVTQLPAWLQGKTLAGGLWIGTKSAGKFKKPIDFNYSNPLSGN